MEKTDKKTLENTVETYLINQVRKIGGMTIKFVQGQGLPDRLVLYQKAAYLVELKRPVGNDQSKLQIAITKKILRKTGFHTFVLNTKDKVDAFINYILK